MQQQRKYSTAEKIAHIQKQLQNPELDAFERKAYEDAIALFQKQTQPSSPPTPKYETVTRTAQSATTSASEPRRAPVISIQRPAPEVKVQGASPTRYTTRITIERVGEEPEILTLGECRSKFWTRLDELLNTTAWQNQLHHELPAYATFQNAATYYAALTAHWQRRPSLRDLEFNPSRFSEIFEIVTNYQTP